MADNVLMLVPMVALLRVARQGPSTSGADVQAGVLLGLTVLTMLIPARLVLPPVYRGLDLPPPWGWLLPEAQIIVWSGVLIFLLGQARRAGSQPRPPPGRWDVFGRVTRS